MKTYDIDYQLAYDVDWFLIDENNTIAHFASGGGILPKVVADNAQETIMVRNFFKEFLPVSEVSINPILNAYSPYITDENLKGFKFFASRGILSYDKTFESHSGDIMYHLVASPSVFLRMEELPDSVRKALDKMRIKVNLRDFYKIDAGYIPWASLFEDYEIKPLYEPPAKKKKTFWWEVR